MSPGFIMHKHRKGVGHTIRQIIKYFLHPFTESTATAEPCDGVEGSAATAEGSAATAEGSATTAEGSAATAEPCDPGLLIDVACVRGTERLWLHGKEIHVRSTSLWLAIALTMVAQWVHMMQNLSSASFHKKRPSH